MNKKMVWIIFISIIGLLIAGLGYHFITNKDSVKEVSTGLNIGEHPPAFTLYNLDGQQVTIGKENKITVLNFWATWCPPCRAEFPELDRFVKKNRDKILFYSIDLQEDSSKVKEFFKNGQYSFSALLDKDGAMAKQFRITAIPTTIILDDKGIIRYRKTGGITQDELENIIAKL